MIHTRILSILAWSFTLSCAHAAISPDRCEQMLMQLAREGPHAISNRLFRAVIPHSRPYRKTLAKLQNAQVGPSGMISNSVKTWTIRGHYRKGPAEVTLTMDGHKEISTSVSLGIEGRHDPLQDEMYFVVADSLNEAKAALGISPGEIFQVAQPTPSEHIPRSAPERRYWKIAYWLSRVTPTYGVRDPYPKEQELQLKFAEILINKIHDDIYTAKSNWKPNVVSEAVIKVGSNRIYLREMPSDKPGYHRVVVHFAEMFMFQFAKNQAIFPYLPSPSLRGTFLDFVKKLKGEFRSFEVNPASPFLDSKNKAVDPNDAPGEIHLDVVARENSQPVIWIRKITEGFLSQYSISTP